VEAVLSKVDISQPAENSTLVPRWNALVATLAELRAEVSRPPPEDNAEVAKAVIAAMPSFVYYSNYGNLDSEIYLPHVIENLKRKGLGTKEEAKARTLKVLFEYVKLQPEEILELGARAVGDAAGNPPTKEAIAQAAERTKERSILLRSADTDLTKSFRDWWKQGDYRFRFAADGDHFRIWVSDDKRPEEIELEARSTGLQWFFSFFLVFLVERRDAHKGAVLLLDEPGLSLHPLSQQDLSLFFQNLSQTNPILFTTHSPFMVDADHLDRVRLVYVDDSGATAVTADLRATSPQGAETRSVYAVHAALGLSVSAALLQGCASVIVEGPSDQFYFSAMKTVLIARKKIAPKRELLFVPAGGAKGVNSMAPIVTAKDEAVPVVVLDDDEQGRQFADSLKKGPLYKGASERVLNVRDFAGGLDHAEVEDLLPSSIVADAVSRVVRGKDDDFKDAVKAGSPIVPQIEAYAQKNGAKLAQGWKVDLAREVKKRVLRDIDKIDDATLDGWTKLFEHFEKRAMATRGR
jgi:predicted ATPase